MIQFNFNKKILFLGLSLVLVFGLSLAFQTQSKLPPKVLEEMAKREIFNCEPIPYGQFLSDTDAHLEKFLPLLVGLQNQAKQVGLSAKKMVDIANSCKSENCEGNCKCPKKEECKKTEKGCKTDNDCIPSRPMCNPSTGECGCTTPPDDCRWCPPAGCGMGGCSKENYEECLAKGLLPPPPPKGKCSADKNCPSEKPKCNIATGECGCMTKSPECAWCRPENCATTDCNKMFYEDCKGGAAKGEEGYKCVEPCQEEKCSGSPCPVGIAQEYNKLKQTTDKFKETFEKLRLLERELDQLGNAAYRIEDAFGFWYRERNTASLFDCYTLKDMNLPEGPSDCPFNGNTYFYCK